MTTVALFATHWSPNGANEITTACELCTCTLGVTRLDVDPWRPYTRVVVSVRTPREVVTDVSHWCPLCWPTEGRSTKQRQFPDAEFMELEPPGSKDGR